MASFDIDVDASELDDLKDNLARLGANVASDEKELQQGEPNKMKEQILRSVRRNFENTRTSDTDTSLLDAFYVASGPYGQQITTVGTGADHAMPLEKGISPHIIEGNPTLAFQPENIGDYPPSSHAGGGYVTLDSVMWEPDKSETATGYEYVYEAQSVWDKSIGHRLPRKIQNSIRAAGFKRER